MYDRYSLLDDIETIARERIGIVRLREEDSDLYGYYLNWLIRKEQKLIRKYRKKYGNLPMATV